jgi:hypothetical protein
MAAKDRIGKATETVLSSEYLKRLMEDEQLRENLLAAYGAARSAYGRVSNGKPAGNALKEASFAFRQPQPTPKRKGGAGRGLLLLLVGAVLALALSESLRSKVLDLLFGAEEEFDYSSTTMPAAEAPAPADISAA